MNVLKSFKSIGGDGWCLSLWKVVFAAVAVADLTACWPILMQGWNESCNDNSDTCTAATSRPYSIWIGPLFCVLCIIEAVIRAKEARTLAIENHALDNFEKSLQRVYSTTRMSFSRFGVESNANVDEILVRSTLRTWIPVLSVIAFWLSLLPISLNYQCGNDAALTSMWITSSFTQFTLFSEMARKRVTSTFWKWVRSFFKIRQPKRFYKRIRQALSLIRWIRFAGPLFRMGLKLSDQLGALTRTWRQSLVVQSERAKRLARRSMLFDDIKRVESLAKVQTALAALPSQLWEMAEIKSDGLQIQQEQGRKIWRQLQQLKRDIGRNLETSVLYDRVVQMTQELKVTLNDTLLSSHYLISPHSRFSVAWRLTVSNCLLLEIFRLGVSWHLSETFNMSLTKIISRLFIECEHPNVKDHFAFITDRVDDVRKHLSRLLLFLPPPEDLNICVPSSPLSMLILQMGGVLESFIDIVIFLDIFIWFFTGDLDVKGVIVPKPFFTRCILPGTLVQVLDHPTLPETLPALISQAMDAASATGWSRVIRWVLAVSPAFAILVIDPLKSYFFRHMDTAEGMMRYAESCGVLAPSRPSMKSMDNLHSVASHPSQLGMSFDSPPMPGHRLASISTIEDMPALPPSSQDLPRHSTIRFSPSIEMLDEADSYNFSYSYRTLHED